MGGQSTGTTQANGAAPMAGSSYTMPTAAQMPQTPPAPQLTMPLSGQPNGQSLASLFMNNAGYGGQGYQQTPIAPITAPAYGQAALTPQQAAAATMARMKALNPTVVAAPAKPAPTNDWGQRGGNGSASGRGSGGAW